MGEFIYTIKKMRMYFILGFVVEEIKMETKKVINIYKNVTYFL